MKKIKLAFLFAAVIAVCVCVFSVFTAAATVDTSNDINPETTDGGIIVETVNLINASKNQRGAGFFWDNPNDTLTITNMTIDTVDNYGLRLPGGSTLVLEGNNTIKAKQCALSVEGSLTVKGSGTLTIISEKYGMIVTNLDMNKKLTFIDGSVKITSGEDGIFTEYAIVTQNDKAKLEINAGSGHYAIKARQIKLLGGSFKSDASLYADDIKLMNIKLNITSSSPALQINPAAVSETKTGISITNSAIKAGADASSLSSVESYGAQNCLSLKPDKAYTKTSLFLSVFGADIPGTGWIDFALIGLAVLIVAAFIAIPYIKNHREKGDVAAKIAAAREEEKKNMRERRAAEENKKDENNEQ